MTQQEINGAVKAGAKIDNGLVEDLVNATHEVHGDFNLTDPCYVGHCRCKECRELRLGQMSEWGG